MLCCVCYICSISNILCLQHLLPTVDLWWYSISIFFGTTCVHISFCCMLIRFHSFILIGPMLAFVPDVIVSRTNTLSVEFRTMFNRFTILCTGLPSLVSTWLKTVVPSVLAGRWHVSLVFLTQISVSIRIT